MCILFGASLGGNFTPPPGYPPPRESFLEPTGGSLDLSAERGVLRRGSGDRAGDTTRKDLQWRSWLFR